MPCENRFMASGHDVDVARALAVPEQRALHPVGAGQHRQLGRRHRGAAVVVGVQAEHDGVAVLDGAPEPLDHVGVDVGAVHLDRGGQVEDHRPLGRRLHDVHHRLADLDGELGLGPGEALGRVLVADVGAGDLRLVLLAQLRRLDRDVDDARPCRGRTRRGAAAPTRSCRSARPPASRPPATRRCARSAPRGTAPAPGSRRPSGISPSSMMSRWKSKSVCDADGKPTSISLKPDVDEGLEQRELALGVHGVDQGLVAVAQVDAGPAGRPRELAVGPRAVAQHERHVRPVLPERHG